LQPIVQGVFRVFGTSPAMLLSRMSLLNRGATRYSSVESIFTSTSKNSGVFEYTLKDRPDAPRDGFILIEGIIQHMIELCRRKGKVSPAELVNDPEHGRARYLVSW
jgi:hypothetical protein